MEELKIFLSSRVKSLSNSGDLDRPFTLEKIRAHLKGALEKETLLDEYIWDVVINETDFNSPIATNAFDNCINKMRGSNVIIILYNGEADWGTTEESKGICHEEFLIAAKEFSQMAFALDLHRYFQLPVDGPNSERNRNFAWTFRIVLVTWKLHQKVLPPSRGFFHLSWTRKKIFVKSCRIVIYYAKEGS